MCGRFVLTSPGAAIAERFGLRAIPSVAPRYNIAPTQKSLVVRHAEDGAREAAFTRWGLVPAWANDEDIGQKCINARSETAADKPAFRAAFKRRRCLVPADGFYEWAPGKPKKRPHLIRLSGGDAPFAMAGLWERWEPEGRDPVETFTILTTEANDVLAPLHDRMPAMVAPPDVEAWLAPEPLEGDLAQRWAHPWPGKLFEVLEVTTAVNDVRRDGPECVTPISTLPF